MKICSNCGNKLNDAEKKCIVCKTTAKTAIFVDEKDKDRIDEVIASVRAAKGTSKPKKKSKILPIIITIIVIAAIGSLLGGNDDSEKEPVKPAVSGDTSSSTVENNVIEPEITVTAGEVINLFEENEVKGKQTYTGKLAEITGIVDSIGESFGQTYVTIGTGEQFEIVTLQCFFKDKDEINKVAELKKGDEVTIIGTIGEQSINIGVNNCILK